MSQQEPTGERKSSIERQNLTGDEIIERAGRLLDLQAAYRAELHTAREVKAQAKSELEARMVELVRVAHVQYPEVRGVAEDVLQRTGADFGRASAHVLYHEAQLQQLLEDGREELDRALAGRTIRATYIGRGPGFSIFTGYSERSTDRRALEGRLIEVHPTFDSFLLTVPSQLYSVQHDEFSIHFFTHNGAGKRIPAVALEFPDEQ